MDNPRAESPPGAAEGQLVAAADGDHPDFAGSALFRIPCVRRLRFGIPLRRSQS